MRRVLWLTLAVAALFGCRRPPGIVPMGPPGPPGPPRPPQVPGAPNPPSPKWSTAYDRACTGSITEPVVSADGASVAFCERMFDAKRGTFSGMLPIGVEAVLHDGRVISNDYAGHWRLGRPGAPVDGQAPGSVTNHFAISPSGKRMATVEGDSIVIRDVAPLTEVARIDVGDVSPEPVIGFFADGRVTAIVPGGCTTERGKNKDGSSWQRTQCSSKSWMVVEDDKLVKLRDATDLRNVVFAGGGTRAVVEREDGGRAIIALPGGEPIADLPVWDTDEAAHVIEPMGLSGDGKRVAYVDDGVVIAAVDGSKVEELGRMKGADPASLVFSPDGKTLYLARNDRMIAFREGEPERTIAMPRYDVKAPVGFVPFRAECPIHDEPETTGGDDLCRERQRLGADAGSLKSDGMEVMLPEGHVKAFIDSEHFVDVYVTAVDAAEYPEKDDAAWAESIVRASVWSGSEKGAEEAIKMRGPRAFEYAEFWRDGCDPKDVYVSAFERDGLLYRVRIEVPPEHPQKALGPLFKAFVDEPFGSGDAAAHAFAKPPRAPDGPC